MEDIDIFIVAHRNFQQRVWNPAYKVLTLGEEKIDTTLDTIVVDQSKELPFKHMPRGYSEILRMIYVAKHVPLKKYVGFCHYRRYPEFMDDVDKALEILKEKDIIVHPEIHRTVNVYDMYRTFHNRMDLNRMVRIISDKYPSHVHKMYDVLNNNTLFMNNVFIMKSEDFIKYVDYIIDVFSQFDKELGFITDEDVLMYVKANGPDYHLNETRFAGYPNSEPEYQSRIQAFLSERVFTEYVMNTFKKIRGIKIKVTENVYTVEK